MGEGVGSTDATAERADGGALLIGSVPMRDAVHVMRTMSVALGDRLRRLPDGETGPRADWIMWQYPVLSARPELEVCPPGDHPYRSLPRLRLRPRVSGTTLELGGLGYADAALASYRVFSRLQAQGLVPPWCRFQVSLPTPLSPISAFVAPVHQAALEPVYERALLGELGRILAGIPHDRLAVQWDTNFEFAMVDGLLPVWFEDVRTGIVDRLVRLAERVPPAVELGFHFCQDHERRQHDRPYDARRMVEVANALSARVGRRIDWLHLPAPSDRLDVVFFEKLAPLALPDETELYLGLVHVDEGAAGVAARVTAARRYLDHFGLATPCGWGRHRPQDVEALVDLHTRFSAPVRARAPAGARRPGEPIGSR